MIKQKIVILLSLIGFILSCDKSQPMLIPEEKLVEVVADLHIAETVIMETGKDARDSMASIYFAQICEIHQVDSADVTEQLKRYEADSEEFKRLYDKVMKRFDKLEVK